MDIVRKIDEIRVKKGWSFYKLSQESGLSQQTFTKWIDGTSLPSLTAINSICDAFGISLSTFFADENLIEVNEDTKNLIDNWNYLSKEEKDSILKIMENYINNKH